MPRAHGPLSPDERARLLALLAAHEPSTREEAAHLERIASFAAREPDPFDRSVAQGHITGSAFVLDGAGRLLLTHHRRLGIWVQLGGHAEDERAAEDVAMREAREESGLSDLRFAPALLGAAGPRLLDVDVHRIPARAGEPEHDHLDLRFLLETSSPETIVADPRETKALEWVDAHEARRRCDPGMLRALDKIARMRA